MRRREKAFEEEENEGKTSGPIEVEACKAQSLREYSTAPSCLYPP